MNKMKIIVIGGSGFIGSRLVQRLLKHEHDVQVYDKNVRSSFSEITIQGDVRDEPALVKACRGVDVIYNLAAEHADDVRPISLYYDVNVYGARNIVSAAIENSVKQVVFISTVALYGLNVGVPDESFPLRPFNDYGRSKREAELIFEAWVEDDIQRKLVVVRPAVIFGEENRGNVYNLIRQIVSGKFLLVGKGENLKSMGYVENIASFLELCLNFTRGNHLYNYADKPDLKTVEIVKIVRNINGKKGFIPKVSYPVGLVGGYIFDLIAQVTGKQYPISSIRIKKFCASTEISAIKLKETGFVPEFNLEDGLRRMIRYEFEKNRH